MRATRVLVAAVMLPLVGLAAIRPAGAQVPNQTGIRVFGQGRLTAQPDVAILNIGASVRRPTPDAAFDRAEGLITALTGVLRDFGVAERDITTRELSLFTEFLPPQRPDEPPPPPQWRARHFLTVKLRDFSRVGRVVGTSVAALEDAGELQGIFFTIEDTDPLIDRARDAALADARAKAERIASRLGVRLGAVTFVQEFSSTPPTPIASPFPAPTAVRAPSPFPAAQQPVQVSPGEQLVNVSVEVVYAIEPPPGA